jgi:hypothetical protein
VQEAVKGVGGCERWKEAVKGQETVKGLEAVVGAGGWEGKARRLRKTTRMLRERVQSQGGPGG